MKGGWINRQVVLYTALLVCVGSVFGLAFSVVLSGAFTRAYAYEAAAARGGEYLLRMQKDNGSFVYIYYPEDNTEHQSYNILRHAGTVYSMLELSEHTNDASLERALIEGARRGLVFLLAQTKPCPDVVEALCVVEGNEIKLGGSGLAVLSLAEYERITEDSQFRDEAVLLAKWITASQSEEGEFTKHKIVADSGEVTEFVSEYYPGEALYGLMRLYAITGDEALLVQAQKGASFILETRKDIYYTSLPHDHWLLYALNELHKVDGDKKWVKEAYRLSFAIMRIQHPPAQEGDAAVIAGGFYTPARVAPTATRVEGLKSAHEMFVRENLSLVQAMTKSAIEAGREFLLRTQFTEDTLTKRELPMQALGGFPDVQGGQSIRIDYVQHAISALLD